MMKPLFYNCITAALGLAAILALPSCDSMVYDDLDPCPPAGVRLPFRYDMNMKFADAFAHEVTEVDLYIYTADGHLVGIEHEQGLPLAVEGYQMELDYLQPGTYQLVAWAKGDNSEHNFISPDGTTVPSMLTHTLSVESDTYGNYSDKDLRRLYHASQTVTVPAHDKEIVVLPPMKLTKDTNVVRVLLQHLDGSEISHDDFDFAITENYTRLDHTNTPADFSPLTYRPWAKESAHVIDPVTGSATVATLLAEVTTSRLMTPEFSKQHYAANNPATKADAPQPSVLGEDQKPYLNIVSKKNGRTVVRVPLSDYLLMVKGNHNRQMDDQEYLDRQDEYSLHFFLDNDNNWYMAAGIYVNSWHVVLKDADL